MFACFLIRGSWSEGMQGKLSSALRCLRSPSISVTVVFTHAAAALLATDGMSSAKAGLGLRENPSPSISKSDEDFEKMGVEFVWGYHDINLEDLNDLFSRVRTLFGTHS